MQVLLVFLGVFCGLNIFLYSQLSELLHDQVIQRSITLAQTATAKDVVMRDWMASLGGVFVPVTENTPPNPYLPPAGREVTLPNGTVLTRMNPAYVTRLIHERWSETHDLPSHITSLLPVNPLNAPLDWEVRGLEYMIALGQSEYTERVDADGDGGITRYVSALRARPACLNCHTTQGYKLNDIMGGLSIEVPDSLMVGTLQKIEILLMSGYGLATVFMLVTLVWGGRKLIKSQVAKQDVELSLRRLATTLEAKVQERTLALNAEKERMQTILADTLEGILQLDNSGCVTYLNPAALDMLGYEEEDILGTSFHSVLAPAYTPDDCPLCKARREGVRHIFSEHLMRCKDGKVIQVSGSVSPVHEGENDMGCVVVFHSLNTLDELSFLQKIIFSNASEPFFILDSEGHCLCNDAALHFFGAPDVESISNDLLRYSADYQRGGGPVLEAHTAIIRECDEKGNVQTEWMHRHEDGTPLPCLVTMTKIQHHKYQGYFVSVKDLRPQQKFEQQLEDEKTFLRTILDTIPDMIIYKSPEGLCRAVNKAMAIFLDREQGDLLGKTDDELYAFAPDQVRVSQEADKMAIAAGGIIRYEAMAVSRTGTELQLDTMKTPCYAANGTLLGVLGIARDITSLVQAREDAKEASRAKSDFLARMSHEIRTPMNAILGMTYICLQNAYDGSQLNSLNKILSAGKGLLSLINDILDVSKIEAGKMKLEKAPCNMNEILNNLGDICSALIAKKNVEVLFQVSPQLLLTFEGDAARLNQVLNNLLSNSIKFTDKGEIVLRIQEVARHGNLCTLRFEVSDTGIGMDESQINSIFRPFVQADISTTRKYGGTGLGLVICQHFVNMMGGSFEVTSAPGLGSSFSFAISMPIVNAEPQLWDKAENLNSERLLVVDDSTTAREVLMELLQGFGFRVDAVSSGDEACQRVKKAIDTRDPYSLVLLDWKMPAMDGYTCAQYLNSLSGDSPIKLVMVSAYGQDEYTKNKGGLGLADFIGKPVQPMELWSKVMKALGKGDNIPQAENIRKIDERLQMDSISGAQVLLVEDNETNQEVATRLMERMGMKVTVASNGVEAVDITKLKTFDIVFMDIQMPAMDGIEATRIIRRRPETALNKLPIIAMTAHAMVEDREKSLSVGMNEHITKPITPDTLAQVLLKWVKPKPKVASPSQATQDVSRLDPPAQGAETFAPLGIDWERGLHNVGGEVDILLKHLNYFPERYSHYATMLHEQSTNHDWEKAARTAHTLKGVAATLGMQTLADCASILEKSFMHTTEDADTLTELQRLLTEVCEGIENANPQAVEEPVQETDCIDTSALEQSLRMLKQIFRTDVMECMEVVKKIQYFVPRCITEDVYKRLHKAVYEFNEEALNEAVQEALTSLAETPTP